MYFVICLWFLSLDIFTEDSSIFRCFTVYLSYSLMCNIPMCEYTTSLCMYCQWIFGYFPVLAVINSHCVLSYTCLLVSICHNFCCVYLGADIHIFRFTNQPSQPTPQGYSLSFMSNSIPWHDIYEALSIGLNSIWGFWKQAFSFLDSMQSTVLGSMGWKKDSR